MNCMLCIIRLSVSHPRQPVRRYVAALFSKMGPSATETMIAAMTALVAIKPISVAVFFFLNTPDSLTTLARRPALPCGKPHRRRVRFGDGDTLANTVSYTSPYVILEDCEGEITVDLEQEQQQQQKP